MPTDVVIRDLVVVLPGIMGSTLTQKGKPIWEPSAGCALRAIATFGASIRNLTLPKDIGDDCPDDGVEARELMPDLHVLPGIWTANIGYGALVEWLTTQFHFVEPSDDPSRIPNLLRFPYDWRLSNRYNARRLKEVVEPALDRWQSQGGPFSDAKVIFIGHSMGGLVARWYIEKEHGAEITRKLITLGTPYRGALNALDQLVNGVRKGFGPIKFDLTSFARSLPSLYQLLPEYACVDSARGLLKTTEVDLPKLDKNKSMVADAMRFHDDLDDAAKANASYPYVTYPILGFRQPTWVTATIEDDAVVPSDAMEWTVEDGDATVPSFAALPKGLAPDSPAIHHFADQHGALQSNRSVLDELEGALTAKPVVYRDGYSRQLGVRTERLVLAGECICVEAAVSDGGTATLSARTLDEQGNEVETQSLDRSGRRYRAEIGPLKPGAYRIIVEGGGPARTQVAPVTTTALVWGEGK